jgi:hypothetical protein
MSRKTLIVSAIALTTALGAGIAQAQGRDDVQWSVTIGTPIYSQPIYSQPVYSQPFYTPAPVYTAPPVYAPAYGYRYGQHHRQPTRWDRDGDGIPNRYDRYDNRTHEGRRWGH